MTLIVCLDDKNGMAFNGRRQSADRILRAKLLSRVAGQRLLMSGYSAAQFDPLPAQVVVDDDFLANGQVGDACFVETQDITGCLAGCTQLIIYRWNRVYPADLRFPVSELTNRWTCVSKVDFAGNSHERITEEIYAIK